LPLLFAVGADCSRFDSACSRRSLFSANQILSEVRPFGLATRGLVAAPAEGNEDETKIEAAEVESLNDVSRLQH